MDFIVLFLAAIFAGLIDAIVGGGGLISIPALFSVYPNASQVSLLGTNKLSSISGTTFATYKYSKRVNMPWTVLIIAGIFAFTGSLLGSWTVSQIDPSILRKALPFIMFAVLVYTLLKKELGSNHQPLESKTMELFIASFIALIIGWYDGFFGPGTGSFFIFLFVRFLGYDFLHASASSKFLNVATNFAAILMFSFQGELWWILGVIMAFGNIVGSFIGSHLALKHGSGFVRIAFIIIVSLLIIKTFLSAF